MRLNSSEQGSLPLALLASIVVAGLITALVGTVIQSERTVRFDRSYTNAIHGADAGLEDVYYRLSHGGLTFSDDVDFLVESQLETHSGSLDHNGQDVRWEVTRTGAREYDVVSTSTESDGTSRTVVATIEEDALFFPGAFGDRLVALNGSSTEVDSYESGTPTSQCNSGTAEERARKCWGTDPVHGTRKGALGTNEDFDFSGNMQILRAILYDWYENPGKNITDTNPGGSRCKGQNLCTHEVLDFEDEPLDYSGEDAMAFIHDKLEACTAAQERGNWKLGGNQWSVLTPFNTSEAGDNPTDPAWDNYYCADSLEFLDDVAVNADPDGPPVVIFVRDSVKVNNHVVVNCPNCPKNTNHEHRLAHNRPRAPSLQIYVATETPTGGADVNVAAHGVFGGVLYAPRARCGASGNAGAHIYGALICRTIDNVGNWRFHFDEQLADYGRGTFTTSRWQEDHTRALE